MKSCFIAVAVSLILAASPVLAAKDVGAYVAEAQALAESGKFAEAISLLQEGVTEHPRSAELYANLGLYAAQSAGRTTNFAEAGRLVTEAFSRFDKAVELEPENPIGYFYRGAVGVQLPAFLGRLESGRSDLERVVRLAPGSDLATQAKTLLAGLPAPASKEPPKALFPQEGDSADIAALKKRIEAEPSNAKLVLDLGRALVEAGRFGDARDVIMAHNAMDPSNVDAYRLLFAAVGGMAEKGYDARISGDTNLRTNLAFEAMSAAEKIVELAPDDVSARLQRGIVGIAMPFFVGKFDQGIADLEYVLKHTTSPTDSAQAMYWLGAARERQAMRFWFNVATKYPESDVAEMALAGMRPVVARIDPSKQPRPYVSIDFVLGFRDELAPQVAIWIEDASGAHVKTVFVSGFAGNVKGKQVTLPVWAAISNFEGADAVTGASIDVGHYVYVWDCRGLDGKPVKPGRYTAKVEVMHWPSGRYQLAEASIAVGKKEDSVRVEEGDYIPSLVVTYFPK